MDLAPGEGVGLFKLGMTLWDTINLLRSTSIRQVGNLTQSSLSWSDEDPTSSYIVLNIEFNALVAYRLIFPGQAQRLEIIEVLPPAISSVITWKGRPLLATGHGNDQYQSSTTLNSSSSTSSPPSSSSSSSTINPQRLLNSKFGPTYPPSAHPSFEDELVLSYPGVVFGFPQNITKTKTDSTVTGSATSRAKDITDARCASAKSDPTSGQLSSPSCPLNRMLVSRHDPSANHAPPYPDISKLVQSSNPYPLSEGDISFVDIHLQTDSSRPTSLRIHIVHSHSSVQVAPVEIQLGVTSSEDLSCTFGPPLRVYYKEDTRLSIHNASRDASDSTGSLPLNAYFYNYFPLGLDFLLHPETNRVIKVVLHSNTPGEVLFGRYNKCRWRIYRNVVADSSKPAITSEDPAQDIPKAFASRGATSVAADSKKAGSNTTARPEKTMLLDRLADNTEGILLDRPAELVAQPGCIFEVTQSGWVETLWLV